MHEYCCQVSKRHNCQAWQFGTHQRRATLCMLLTHDTSYPQYSLHIRGLCQQIGTATTASRQGCDSRSKSGLNRALTNLGCHDCEETLSTVGLLGRDPRFKFRMGPIACVSASLLVVLACVRRLSNRSGAESPKKPLRMLSTLTERCPMPYSSPGSPLAAAAAKDEGPASLPFAAAAKEEGPASLPLAVGCSCGCSCGCSLGCTCSEAK